MKARPSGPIRRGLGARRRRALLRVALPAALAAVLAATLGGLGTASADGGVSARIDAQNGFPTWYQDAAGNRVAPCIDGADPNCVLPAPPVFDPAQPTVFPTNFPDEFFYALADSDIVNTPGCGTSPAGKASVRLALEGAFLNSVTAGDQMAFGRIRVKVTSGLCPNTTYRFRHPFGVETLTTNAAGAIPANVGTEDIGCTPAPPLAACDFAAATASRVFGTKAGGGFLRWDPAVGPAAPDGYLGDGVTPHAVVGGSAGNDFAILNGDGTPTGLSTALFTVAGKLAGSLEGDPSTLDFGGQDVSTTSASKTVTVTNLDSADVTVTGTSLTGAAAGSFAVSGGTCTPGTVLPRDTSCTVDLAFTPSAPGRVSATLEVPSTGGVRSPLTVAVTGSGTTAGQAPALDVAPSLDFPNTRVRTSSAKTLTVTNTGTAPLGVTSVAVDLATAPESDHFRVLRDGCAASGLFVDPGKSCQIEVLFAPLAAGVHASSLAIATNAPGSPAAVALNGTGTGGIAAVSPTTDPSDGFPDWYRDEAGVKVAKCVDPGDPFCIVLPDEFFDPAKPLSFPTNYPGEFFYQVATSDNVPTPGCQGTNPGRAFIRSAVEGTFVNGGPVPGDQMVFGRIRIVVTGGLCPNTTYTFTHPYGADQFTTNAQGAVARNVGTEDIGCTPVAPALCDFSLALSSRVFAGLLRWDPAVAPAAPPGYLGDAVSLHKVVGAPYSPDGVTPADYFQISDAGGTVVGKTTLFTVMGKLRGPLEADPSPADFGTVPVLTTSAAKTVTLTNTGTEPLTFGSAAVTGAQAGDFAIAPGGTCAQDLVLAVGDACTVEVTFSPGAVGSRSAALRVTHSGLNSPLDVALRGIGGVGTPSLTFVPAGLNFAPLHTGRASAPATVTISNVGGSQPLEVGTVDVIGPGAGSFSVTGNTCGIVAPGATCQVQVVFSPLAAGAVTASLRTLDNAPGGVHTMPLTGTGSDAAAAVSAGVDADNGFPNWYQDENGVKVAPCLDAADTRCIVLADAFFDPTQPELFPSNFPGEFFYALADSDQVPTDGCNGTTTPGFAFIRVALEGSFANGAPAAGDQTMFGRIRIFVKSGLCANTPYNFVTPYGSFQFTTDADGAIVRNAATQDVGCGAAPCNFADALASPVAKSFLRWDPNYGPAAPAGYLGDALSFHRVVGATYAPAGVPVNAFRIQDLADNVVGSTDKFLVMGRLADAIVGDPVALGFGHLTVGSASSPAPATFTNTGAQPVTIASVAIAGSGAPAFSVAGGTCGGATLAKGASCVVPVVFAPNSAGAKTAQLTVTSDTGASGSVTLEGIGDLPPSPGPTPAAGGTGRALTGAITPAALRGLFLPPVAAGRPVPVAFTLSSPAAAVRLVVTTTKGRVVRTVVRGRTAKGRVRLVWNGRDAKGHKVRAGVYRLSIVVKRGKATTTVLIRRVRILAR